MFNGLSCRGTHGYIGWASKVRPELELKCDGNAGRDGANISDRFSFKRLEQIIVMGSIFLSLSNVFNVPR
jgi:hypothetical protein